MKAFVALAVLSCGAMLDAASLFGIPLDQLGNAGKIGTRIGANVGQRFGNGIDAGVRLGNHIFGGGLGRDLANGNIGGNPLDEGLNLFGDDLGDIGYGNFGSGGAQSQSGGYRRGQNAGGQNYNEGASGAQGQAAHNSGAQEFHNNGQHHSKSTSVSQSEDAGSHNIGGSEAHNVGAQAGSAFNNHQNGAAQAANDFAQGAQQSALVN